MSFTRSSPGKTPAPDPPASLHGVLLNVHGIGVVLTGPSGIGKSETALNLLSRGHRLVADDLVLIRRGAGGQPVGEAPASGRGLLEVRGLGILRVQEVFGPSAVQSRIPVALVVELTRDAVETDPGRPAAQAVRLGVWELPGFRIPVHPGRNVALLVEVAARCHLRRARGRVPPARRPDRSPQARSATGGVS